MPQNFHFCSPLGESQVAIFIFAAGKEHFQFSFLQNRRSEGVSVFIFVCNGRKAHILYYTLLDRAANRYLYAVGKFDKRYPYGLQLEKNLCDIAFCYIFIPKCDMAKWYIQNAAKWYIVVRACLLRSVACAPSLRARPTRLRSLRSFQEKEEEGEEDAAHAFFVARAYITIGRISLCSIGEFQYMSAST